MQQDLKSKANLDAIAQCLQSLTYTVDGSGAWMYNDQSGGLRPSILDCRPIREAIEEISAIRKLPPLHVMINTIPPGVIVPKHRDFLLPTAKLGERPCLERWHLPIMTNDNCLFWDEIDGESHMLKGIWHGPIQYWVLHSVWNVGHTPRTHLVVDLDSDVAVGEYID